MSIQSQIERLSSAKTAIAEAIADSGIAVPATAKLDEMAGLIGDIKSGIDTSDATATANDIVENKTAYVNGEKVTGVIPVVDVPVPEYFFDPGNGTFYAWNRQPAGLVPSANGSYPGFVSSDDAIYQLTTQGVTAITPSASRQLVVAGRTYVTGQVYVEGDANLVPGNIAKGVSIFGVTGTFAGGSTEGLPEGLSALACGDFTPGSDLINTVYGLNHGLGVVPNFYMISVGDISSTADYTKGILQILGVRRTVGTMGANVNMLYVSPYEAISSNNYSHSESEASSYWTDKSIPVYTQSSVFKAGYTYHWVCGVIDGIN